MMTQIVEADLDWYIDDDGDDCAQGEEHDYAIDKDYELAVFKDGKVVALRDSGCLQCAELMAEAIECCYKRGDRVNKFAGDSPWVCDATHV
jgi:hypothetical protein